MNRHNQPATDLDFAIARINRGFQFDPDMPGSRELCFADATALIERSLTDAERIDTHLREAESFLRSVTP